MAMVIRVRFKRASKLYDFDPNGLELHTGTRVVTETARGVELGECMSGIIEVPDEHISAPLKPILRIATEQDMLTQKRNEEYEKEAFDIAIERIAEHKLDPGQRKLQKLLAKEVTILVHGEAEYENALAASRMLFGNSTSEELRKLDERTFLAVFSGVPTFDIRKEDLPCGIIDVLCGNPVI